MSGDNGVADERNMWPDRLMIRDTKLNDDMGGLGQRIYTTAGQGYEKREYIRADLVTDKRPLPDVVVTKGGVPMADQPEGIRQFKAACRQSYFPGTASMFASQHKMAVTQEWMRGWNACLDELDRKGVFRE